MGRKKKIEAEIAAPAKKTTTKVETDNTDNRSEYITALPVRVHKSYMEKVDKLIVQLKKIGWAADSNRGITRSSVLRSILRLGLKKMNKVANPA